MLLLFFLLSFGLSSLEFECSMMLKSSPDVLSIGRAGQDRKKKKIFMTMTQSYFIPPLVPFAFSTSCRSLVIVWILIRPNEKERELRAVRRLQNGAGMPQRKRWRGDESRRRPPHFLCQVHAAGVRSITSLFRAIVIDLEKRRWRRDGSEVFPLYSNNASSGFSRFEGKEAHCEIFKTKASIYLCHH